MKLEGKVAVVTGASRGIGKAIAVELASEGALVAVAARTVHHGRSKLPGTIFETVDEIEKIGGKAFPIRCDVTADEDVAEMVEKVYRRYGRLDILINNAGITTPEPFLELTTKKWDLVMSVNLRGTFLCSKAVLPGMVRRQSGSIINLSSVLAKTIRFSVPYGTTKAAIERFTLGLANEVKQHGIAVNALCPDFTATEAVMMHRKTVDAAGWQKPEMWGKYAALVAAENAGRLTGRILDEPALAALFGPAS
jgi:citronellol/citronellal dehydrogenase